MSLPLETVPPIPNIAYPSMILIQTGIVNGKLQTSLQMHLNAAKRENPGTPEETWTATGKTEMIHIADAANPDADLVSVKPALLAAYQAIVDVVRQINAIRKVL